MDEIILLQIIDERRGKIIDSAGVEEYKDVANVSSLLLERKMKYLLVISPHVIPTAFVLDNISRIFDTMSLTGVISSVPSILCIFSFETRDIFYVDVNLLEKDDIEAEEVIQRIEDVTSPIETEEKKKEMIVNNHKVVCTVEVVQGTKFNPAFSRRFEGDLYEIIHDVYSLLNSMEDRIVLAANMYVNSRSEDLKRLFEERVAMDVCVSETPARNQITYLKFLKMSSYIKDASIFTDKVKNDPVIVGGWISAKSKFLELGEYTRKENFAMGDYRSLFIN
jgi:hypothetical protein